MSTLFRSVCIILVLENVIRLSEWLEYIYLHFEKVNKLVWILPHFKISKCH